MGPKVTKSAQAIARNEAEVLFAPLRRFETLVLAVSGGADSLALMTLTAGWQAGLGATSPAIRVATVDHK